MIADMLVLGGLPLVAGVTAYLSARSAWWVGLVAVLTLATVVSVSMPMLGAFAGLAVPVVAALLFGGLCSLAGRLASSKPHIIASVVFLLSFVLVAAIWGASRTGGL